MRGFFFLGVFIDVVNNNDLRGFFFLGVFVDVVNNDDLRGFFFLGVFVDVVNNDDLRGFFFLAILIDVVDVSYFKNLFRLGIIPAVFISFSVRSFLSVIVFGFKHFGIIFILGGFTVHFVPGCLNDFFNDKNAVFGVGLDSTSFCRRLFLGILFIFFGHRRFNNYFNGLVVFGVCFGFDSIDGFFSLTVCFRISFFNVFFIIIIIDFAASDFLSVFDFGYFDKFFFLIVLFVFSAFNFHSVRCGVINRGDFSIFFRAGNRVFFCRGNQRHIIAGVRMMVRLDSALGSGILIAGGAVLMAAYRILLRDPVFFAADKLRHGKEAADKDRVFAAFVGVLMHLGVLARQRFHFAVAFRGMVMPFVNDRAGFVVIYRIVLLLAAGQSERDGIARIRMPMAGDAFQAAHQIALFVVAILVVLVEIQILRDAADDVPLAVFAFVGMDVRLEVRHEMTPLDVFGLGFFQRAHQHPVKARVGMRMLRQAADRLPFRLCNRIHAACGQQHHHGCENGDHPAVSLAHFVPLHFFTSLQTGSSCSLYCAVFRICQCVFAVTHVIFSNF